MSEHENDLPVESNIQEDDLTSPMERFFYHQRRALEETGKALEALLPPGFREHSGEASREFTKGFRILVDAAIDELKKVSEKEDPSAEAALTDGLEEEEDDDRPASTGKGKVKIDID
ncbi:hypothetical protein G4Y79_21205 [Phototrophicus methaneseepsis]|uniref:Uncharacterized protein n=1 Tax=Phototrophicus methaneseepsis TaxID=2710758 RepID=A0A7S8E897_9CHLR|nr:hypothetical protein [Phototrophicus methaneseepsis]QPC82175.1 hypothetical protein G4Y79_21205 [Phototrophicus methaneseepsis]